MSEWVRAESKAIKNIKMNILTKAFDEINIKMDDSVKHISNSFNEKGENVDCGLRNKMTDKLYDIGLCFHKENAKTKMEVRGDFWMSPFRNEEDFVNQVSQEYNKINIKQVARMKGYSVSYEKRLQNGAIELMLYA